MKMKLVVVLILVIILGAFTGCELAPSLPEILTTVRGYNNEIIALVIPQVEGYAPELFTEDSFITVDDGIICMVGFSSSSSLNLLISLDNWVANDGTEINGIIELDFNYYDSPVYISTIETDMAIFNFDRTSVIFQAEVFDEDPATEAFTYDYETFFSMALTVNGRPLIANLMLR